MDARELALLLRDAVTEAQRIVDEPDVDGCKQYPRGFGFLRGSVVVLLLRFEAAPSDARIAELTDRGGR